MAHPRSVLRHLLRAIDKHVTSVAGNQQWRQHVLAQFRDSRKLQDPVRQQQLLLLAQEYADLINNIAHHRGLLASYNLGVDADERNKRMVEATAARVGFKLPQTSEQSPASAAAHQHQQQAVAVQQQDTQQ